MFSFFGNTKEVTKLKDKLESMTIDRDYYKKQYELYKDDEDRKIKSLKADHEIELKKKQAELDLFESASIKKLETEVVDLKTKLAVAETKLEFMSKITDVNADVLDVKELVNKLIEKMPTVNINSIIAGLSGATKTEVKE
jgi:hypothetical protein